MVKLGKRMVAGVLAGVLIVSLGLAPTGTVMAEEMLPEGVGEVIAADGGDGEPGEETNEEPEDGLEAGSTGTENQEENPGENTVGEESAEEPEVSPEENNDEGETAEELEKNSQMDPADDIEDLEADTGKAESDSVSANTAKSVFGTYASGVVDEEYGHIIWEIDNIGGLSVSGTGDFAEAKGDADYRRTPWDSYASAIYSAEVDVTGMKDASYMFYGCNKLKSVDLGNFDTSQVTDMSWMFVGCKSLTNLDLSNLDTSQVTDMNHMFWLCESLSDISGVNQLDTGNVINMNCMFATCKNLVNLDLSRLNTSNVTDMSFMFGSCEKIKNLNVGQINTGSVTDMTGMFSGCSSLKILDISSFDLGSLKSGVRFFEECVNLLTVYTPRNLSEAIELPCETTEGHDWYLPDGSKIAYLPVNLSDSIEIYRNGDDIANGRYGNIEWVIDAYGKLKVSGTGDFASEEYADSQDWVPWREYTDDIISAEVTVTGMTNASSMFYDCSGLESVDLSNFDTSQVKNMSFMFSGCSGLTSLDVSGFDTSNVTDMHNMFSGCSGLTSLDVSSFNTSNVTNMMYMFRGCSGLTSLDVSGFDTGNVTDMTDMFSGCSGLSSLDVSGFNTSCVIFMGGMFSGCSGLTSLDVSSFDTNNVTSMWEVFSGCSGLTSLDLSSFHTDNVTDMSDMFSKCTKLSSVNLDRFNTGNVDYIARMFSGCEDLCMLDLSSFDLGNLDYGPDDVLEDCKRLEMIHTPRNLAYSIALPRIFRDAWYMPDESETKWLPMNMSESVVIYKNKLRGDDIAGGRYQDIVWSIDKDGKLTVSGTGDFAPKKDDDIGNRAPWWGYAEYIVSAEVTVTGMTNASGMFYDCSGLESVDLSNLDTSQVKNMRSMFRGCYGLTELDLSSFDTSRVTDMWHMFAGCSGLTELDLSNFDTGQVKSMGYMFSRCDNLSGLDLSHFDTSQVTYMGDMFSSCCKLANLNLSSFDTSRVTDMSGMFDMCFDLTELDLSSFDTSRVTAMSSMFRCCSALKKLDLSSFDTSRVTAMSSMFSSCSALTELDLSSFDTSQVTDMSDMFESCSALTELDLSSFECYRLDGLNRFFEHIDIKNCGLNTIYTPRLIPDGLTISLPPGTWYRTDGTAITELPKWLDTSIIITKDKVPSIDSPYMKATKRKTAYRCGDHLDISDLTVRYYGSDGKVTYVTDYSTNADQIDMSTTGTKQLEITYSGLTVTVELKVSEAPRKKVNVEITGLLVQDSIYSGMAVTFGGTVNVKTPDGTDVTENTTLTYTYSGKMADGSSYPASASAPVNAGQYTLKAAVSKEDGNYTGSVTYSFAIRPAPVAITVSDFVYVMGEGQALPDHFETEIKGLLNGDQMVKQPVFIFMDMDEKEINKGSIDVNREGSYYIVPTNADAGSNYEIIYRKGILSITEERVAYTVRFEMNGHAGEVPPITGVKAGSLIEAPEEPKAEGYIFKGWYQDQSCKKEWDFNTDVVQGDIVLYACWVTAPSASVQGTDICIQEIQDLLYTGSALKPNVSVYAGDGETLLKAGKDYTIKYCNNVEADTVNETALGGVSASGQEGDNGFTEKLAYVIITGRGNYEGTVYKNFHIKAVSISLEDGEGNGTEAPGFKLKYTEQVAVSAAKEQKPFSSLRYRKAMKAGKDYEVALGVIDARDAREVSLKKGSVISRSDSRGKLPVIPKGYQGLFSLKITGIGNYTGYIEKTVYVADKGQLLKNATVTLGKNQKVIKNKTAAELKKGITLKPAYYDPSDRKYYAVSDDGTISKEAELDGSNVFVVKAGKTCLVYGKDYTVSYAGNRAAGTAVLTITGIGNYVGTKDTSFKIAGISFNAKNIVVDSAGFQTVMSYSGKARTQNKVILYPKGGSAADALTYGVDYTVSYKNNINKGTATLTFTAKPDSGYSGNFKKTFKIAGAELSELVTVTAVPTPPDQAGEENSVVYDGSEEIRLGKPVPYTAEGVKPGGQIWLVNRETGTALKEGRDYRVSYRNNKAVTVKKAVAADKKPVMVIAGKGNYTGILTVTFEIDSGVISQDDMIVPALALNSKNNYQYTPKIKVMDGKKALRVGAGKDCVITYRNNGQENVTRYINGEAGAKTPEAVISLPADSCYRLADVTGETVSDISVPLKLYKQPLKKGELYVIIEEPVYTGRQLKPKGDRVRVYTGSISAVKAAYQSKEDKDAVLTSQNGQYKFTRLAEGIDYTLDYGANILAGRNKGSLMITGNSLKYGGSVTVKFTILKRKVYKT